MINKQNNKKYYKKYYIGLLSGTSIDSIDAALIDFSDPQIKFIKTHAHPIPHDLKQHTLELSQSGQTNLKTLGELDIKWGRLFSDSIQALLSTTNINPQDILAIGSHGQTLWHHPKSEFSFTMQIGNPHIIAKTSGIPTISDFRRSDMALGGQGAPLAPAFHHYYFHTPNTNRVIINLGGIANISYIASDINRPIIGYDTGPANSLLDSWYTEHHPDSNLDYDQNGQWAQTGKIVPELLKLLLNDPYFAAPYPKSTGKDYFNKQWLAQYLKLFNNINNNLNIIPPQDIQATLVELTAITLSDAIKTLPLINNQNNTLTELILCGGGAHNTYLKTRIENQLGPAFLLYTSDQFGIDPNWVEAALFAWLAYTNIENKALDYTTITGASRPAVLGVRYLP